METRPTEGAKVQALRAIFSEQNKVVMGLLPPGALLKPRNDAPPKELSAPKKVACGKPTVGPKPAHLRTNATTTSEKTHEESWRSESSKNESSRTTYESSKNESSRTTNESPKNESLRTTNVSSKNESSRTTNESSKNEISRTFGNESTKNESSRTFRTLNESSRTFGDTIASFMFSSNKENEGGGYRPVPPLPKPRISDLMSDSGPRGSVIDSENYVCKSGFRRRPLPPLEELGPAPQISHRPPHLRLPLNSPEKSPIRRPNYPCPPRPATCPPLPPTTSVITTSSSLREEIEELYEDTLLEGRRPVSLIPEYTAEEEEAELYHDAAEEEDSMSDFSLKLKKPPPPPPVPCSEYLQPNMGTPCTEELYQDTNEDSDEVYEVMPCDEMPDDSGSPLYSNNKKEIEKLKKEEDKRTRKEQREKDKRQKELEKLRKKFGLTGEEIPIDDGLVKWDSRGGKGGDLPVRKGETVLILRMEGNPTGRWLVKNEKGKIGYVELTNIEVDPLSVKSVMSIRRLSMMSAGEDLYCEAKSEEEAIYEVTY